MSTLNTFLVGGAVRDELLGLPVKERDFVVVGATPQTMLDRGFKQVGKDFPVFLHPHSAEEYALARTERKTAPGYHGFSVYSAPDVTLEDDLRRRDLTVNAIARDAAGRLVDPYGGVADLRRRVLRHVSGAFAEDPVRILRVARFAARYHRLGFRVAGETQTLMRGMVNAGEADALVPERVWAETAKALREPDPQVFISTLRGCGALACVLPEVDALFGVPQPVKHHPEIDTGDHLLRCLALSARLGADPVTRFAVLVHDLGKGLTAVSLWPRHHGHDEAGVEPVQRLCRRLRVPNEQRDLGVLVSRYHIRCHQALVLNAKTVLAMLRSLDALRRPQRFEQFLDACEIDARGRLGFEQRRYPQAERLRVARAAFGDATRREARALAQRGLQGKALADRLHQQQIAAVKTALARHAESAV